MPHPIYSQLILILSVVTLAAVAYFDWRRRRVFNVIVLPATALILIITFWFDQPSFWPAVGGAILGFLIFLALFIIGQRAFGPGALGFGDVKLAMMIGAIFGLGSVLPALALGILLAGLGAILLMITGRAQRGDSLPYGAFMALAALIMLGLTTLV